MRAVAGMARVTGVTRMARMTDMLGIARRSICLRLRQYQGRAGDSLFLGGLDDFGSLADIARCMRCRRREQGCNRGRQGPKKLLIH